jgi:hypothetical protein
VNFLLNDIRFLFDGHDLSGDGNGFSAIETYKMADATRLTDTAVINRPTIPQGTFKYTGFSQFGVGLVEETIINHKAVLTDIPILLAKSGNAGDRCEFLNASTAEISVVGGKENEIQLFSIDGVLGKGHGMIDSSVLESGKIVRSTTGAGSAGTQVGAALVTQSIYAIVQLLAIDAGTVVITIQSSADNTFAAPTTRFTFAGQTAVGGLYAVPLAGAVTDAWWRAFLTLSGGAAAVQAAVAIGIR